MVDWVLNTNDLPTYHPLPSSAMLSLPPSFKGAGIVLSGGSVSSLFKDDAEIVVRGDWVQEKREPLRGHIVTKRRCCNCSYCERIWVTEIVLRGHRHWVTEMVLRGHIVTLRDDELQL